MYKELVAELRNITSEIEEYNENDPRSSILDARIVDVMRMADRMAWLCKKEGLLRLREEINTYINTFPCIDVLKQMITLVADGMDPELVREFAVARYYALNLHAHDALAVMIYIEFTRNLQKGADPYVIEELILAIVPWHIEKEYREMAKHEKETDWYKAEVHE